MIVPALVIEMQRAGLGTVDQDLFWEELPQDPSAEGIWVVTRGDAGTDNNAQIISVDVYARYANKLTTEMKLRAVTNWVRDEAPELCALSINPHDLDPTQPDESIVYDIAEIAQTGTVQNQGVDQNGRIIKTVTMTIKFNERN